jgi:hypothetical protein
MHGFCILYTLLMYSGCIIDAFVVESASPRVREFESSERPRARDSETENPKDRESENPSVRGSEDPRIRQTEIPRVRGAESPGE